MEYHHPEKKVVPSQWYPKSITKHSLYFKWRKVVNAGSSLNQYENGSSYPEDEQFNAVCNKKNSLVH